MSVDVNRSGDTSGETFVSYATTDGTANERRDYAAALGRLHFAPGETTKTIRVLITNDVYDDDSETFSISLNNPVGDGGAVHDVELAGICLGHQAAFAHRLQSPLAGSSRRIVLGRHGERGLAHREALNYVLSGGITGVARLAGGDRTRSRSHNRYRGS